MGCSRQESWSGLPFLLIFLTQWSNSWLLHWQAGSLSLSHRGSHKIWTVVKLNMDFSYFFTLRALTKFFSQYPQTTFSIIKVASPSLWPKGDRLTGQHHCPACASLLVTLALTTCWGSLSPLITARETCPCWFHRADQAYGWLVFGVPGPAPPVLASSWPIMALPTFTYSFFSLSLYIYIFQCKVNSLLKSTCGKAHRWTQSYTPSLQSFNLHPLVPWSFPCYLNFLI